VIEFSLPQASEVALSVFNLIGERVALLAEGPHPAGVFTVRFDAGHLSSGVYFYRLRAGGAVLVRKAVLVR
jgi:hypothetical protein